MRSSLCLVLWMLAAHTGCGDDAATGDCPEPYSLCGDRCRDTTRDSDHCGGCGMACPPGGVCVDARCELECAAGQLACATGCANPSSDPANCGACGNACAPGTVCNGGTCAAGCTSPQMACGGGCVDVTTSPTNCGACGVACGSGEICSSGACVCAAETPDRCGTACVDLSSDPSSCGACGTACAADEFCVGGACGPCPPPMEACGGACVDTRTDPDNCGVCGARCAVAEGCAMGVCGCRSGLTRCGTTCLDTMTDASNCGACGNVCPAGTPCSAGECGACGPGLTSCAGSCVDLATDEANCGSCGSAVPPGFVCDGGVPSCATGEHECAGVCVPLNDPDNCGACANRCAGATPLCQLDASGLSASCTRSCPPGQVACGATCTDTSIDPANCGACGASCGASATCSSGMCGCAAGESDCDPGPLLACADLSSDRSNCGTCGTACGAGQLCFSSAGLTACQAATPTSVRLECPSTTFPAGSGTVQCDAYLVYGGTAVPDQRVTDLPETTWSLGPCSGPGALCTDAMNRPVLVTSGSNVGRFTPAGRTDPGVVTAAVLQTVDVRWQRGATLLMASVVLSTEPAVPTGYQIEPSNPVVPYLYRASGCVTPGLRGRMRLLRTFAGGGTAVAAADGWRLSVSDANPVNAAISRLPDGSGRWEETLNAPSAPRPHTITATLGGLDVATTTLTVDPAPLAGLRVTPDRQTVGRSTATGRFQAFADFGSLAFEVTTLGDPANVELYSTRAFPYYWTCSAAPFWPWPGSGTPSTPGVSATLTDYGIYRASTLDGSLAYTMSFPFAADPAVQRATFRVDISGRRALACRMVNVPAQLSQGFSTSAPGLGAPTPGSVQVVPVFSDAGLGADCTHDGMCPAGYCVESRCRSVSAVPQTSAIRWDTSAATVASVSNADGTRGQLTGVGSGTAYLSASYTDSFGSVPCTGVSSVTTPVGPSQVAVNVTPALLCDIIVTTRPVDPSAAGVLPPGGNRGDTGARGIADGRFDTDQEFAQRRAWYDHQGSPTNDQAANDPRVLMPNIAGLTQQYRAVGYFAVTGTNADCVAGNVFPVDVTDRADWDVTSAVNTLTPVTPGATLVADVGFTVTTSGVGRGRATVMPSSTPDRIQAVRATINVGPRFCTGDGTTTSPRGDSNACRHALVFEICGSRVDGDPVFVTPWRSPVGHTSPFPPGVTNWPYEGTAPDLADTAYYATFVGDRSLHYYALQRIQEPAGDSCDLTGSGATYLFDVSSDAAWSSANPDVATVSGGTLSAVSAGSTTITAAYPPVGGLGDTLPFDVSGGAITGIAASPTAALAEVLTGVDGSPVPSSASDPTVRNEVWVEPVVTVSAGSPPQIVAGTGSASIAWTLSAGDTGCVQQYRGTGTAASDWIDFGAVGGTAVGAGAPARFRATTTVPMGGCSVTLRPTCVSTGGLPCAPAASGGVTYSDLTLTVRHGAVADVFIQTPERACAEGAPSGVRLARYQVSAGSAPGMGIDLALCVRLSTGMFLRYDAYSDDNDRVAWTAAGPIADGDVPAAGAFPGHGLARYTGAAGGAGTVIATLSTGAGARMAILDIGVQADAASTLTFASRNSGTAASPACRAQEASAGNPFETCLMAGQLEQLQIFASGPGISPPIDVTSDPVISVTYGAAGSLLSGSGPGRARIVLASPTATSTSGIATPQVITARVNTALAGYENVSIAPLGPGGTWDVAVLTGVAFMTSTTTPMLTLSPALRAAELRSNATIAVTGGSILVDTSRGAAIGLTSGIPPGLFQPGVVTAGFEPPGLMAVRGSSTWSFVYAPVAAMPQTSTLTVQLPDPYALSRTTATVTVSP